MSNNSGWSEQQDLKDLQAVLSIREGKKVRLIFKKTNDKFAGVSYPNFIGGEYVHLPLNDNFYSVDSEGVIA
jgi:hypothetical protein